MLKISRALAAARSIARTFPRALPTSDLQCVSLPSTGTHLDTAQTRRTVHKRFDLRCTATSSEGTTEEVTLSDLESQLGFFGTGPQVPPAQPLVLVISGPSGVGKDAVLKRLQELRPDLHFVVTATSRSMRPGEVEGVDYFFVSKKQFETWRDNDALLEHALVYGEYKGIPRQQVDDALARGTDVVLRIDVQGAATVRRILPDCVTIFLVAESEQALVRRLIARKTEPLDRMVTRVKTARSECAEIGAFDYVVVNREGELEAAVAQLETIIDAHKCRVPPAYKNPTP